ncbi:MAG: TetR/AcrR family transcriptional regulator [Peptococcaceae bacterium]|jgi:AcrR family transcriptional regulator|nr:TetR/AcrR family transcriptional regulator [Peptococcaceae bacterium]
MAQILKDEIRERILAAALDEFYERGYKLAAMRSIAAKAKISASLTYSYYKNKAELFDVVIRPVLYDWGQVLSASSDEEAKSFTGEVYGLSKAEMDCLLNLFEHRKEFIILINKSGGTKYEFEKERFIKEIEAHLLKHCADSSTDAFFIHIVANNFVDSLMQILYHYQGKEWAIKILHKLSKMYLSGIGF